MSPIQKQAFQLRPMAVSVSMLKDDLKILMNSKHITLQDWKNAQKVADDAINKASKAAE